jgi:uncharacterized protein (DUF58 family)
LETDHAPLIFDSGFLAKLEQLHILSRRAFRGANRADRPTRQIGTSLEFADFRNYVRGDDPRTIDWNIYGRLDRLFVKLFEQEQDLHVYFLLDASGSMRWKPEALRSQERRPSKMDQMRKIAASLAYITLANLDRAKLGWFGSELGKTSPMSRGKAQFHELLEFLRNPPEFAGPTDLRKSMRSFVHQTKRRGLVFVLSDFFDPAGYEEPLALLQYEQFDVQVIQVLDPLELDPAATGDLRLSEAETGSSMEITADTSILNRYLTEMDGFVRGLSEHCRKRGMAYAQASTKVPFEDLALRVLRDGMILK